MTPELQKRFELSKPPFDGRCIRNVDELHLSQLREMLTVAFASLKPRFPSVNLFHDWHEHDGYIEMAKEVSWDSLIAVSENDQSLYESRDDSFAVRIAIFDPSFEWLLRYNIDSTGDDYQTASCDFDLSASPRTDLSSIQNELLNRFPTTLTVCVSQTWFTSRYGG